MIRKVEKCFQCEANPVPSEKERREEISNNIGLLGVGREEETEEKKGGIPFVGGKVFGAKERRRKTWRLNKQPFIAAGVGGGGSSQD